MRTAQRSGLLLMILGVMMGVLVACGGDGAPVIGGGGGDVIQWDRDPLNVVFRAEITGGDVPEFERLSQVPLCTIYGDGRLVWTNEAGFQEDILFDQLDDGAITRFIAGLTVEERFYTYEDGISQSLPTAQTPVYQRLTMNVNGISHTTDEFAQWPTDYNYFERLLNACRELAVTPRRFEPQGAWLSVRVTDYDARSPEIIWDPDASGLSFSEIDGEGGRRWIEGNNVGILWNILYDNNLNAQLNERGTVYNIALQVPGVTIDAPPAPQVNSQ